ncbi:MAG: D-alanine--D-alanine ligase [Lentisphaeria bacterium]|nr:D-alanine--D-alanine ligase [Lentisphaeria bacterium]
MQVKTFSDTTRNIKIAVLLGGTSSERDVSIKSGTAVAEALESIGANVSRIDLTSDTLPANITDYDVVFPVLHGGFGENGGIQQLLEDAQVPYVGSGPEPCRIMISKQLTKDVLEKAGLPIPKGIMITQGIPFPDDMDLPLIVKPNNAGSTFGLTIVKSPEQWDTALELAFSEDTEVVVEEFVTGHELTVGMIDGHALTPVEIIPPGEIYDFDAKYEYKNGKTEYHCPPLNIAEELLPMLKQQAVDSWNVLNARHLLRVDMILDPNTGISKILEVNNLPGFTSTSLLPKSANEAGIDFPQLCTHLVLSAISLNK